MKKEIYFTIMILLSMSLSLISQNKSDERQILKTLINTYSDDSTYIYYKFRNSDAIDDFERFLDFIELEEIGYFNNSEIIKEESYDIAKLTRHFKNDSVDLVIKSVEYNESIDSENVIKFDYKKTIKTLNKKDNKRFRSGLISSTKNRLKKGPIVFLSMPIISYDRKYAITFVSYVVGPLNAGGSIVLLNNDNGKWVIIDYIYTWIS